MEKEKKRKLTISISDKQKSKSIGFKPSFGKKAFVVEKNLHNQNLTEKKENFIKNLRLEK